MIAPETIDAHWCRGRVLGSSHVGVFPPSYCWEMDPANYIRAGSNGDHAREGRGDGTNKVEKFAKVGKY